MEDIKVFSRKVYQDIIDKGIATMSKKLKCLRRIDLSGSINISGKSLTFLSSDSESLTEIVLHYNEVSQDGISRYNSCNPASFDLPNSVYFSKCTKTIDLDHIRISDDLLSVIVEADIPLENFHLAFCKNFTIDAIYTLLEAYPLLKSFSLCGKSDLTDESVTRMRQFITKLNSIKLNSCSKLTFSSFIAIASACRYITNIEIDSLSQGKIGLAYASGYAKNFSITSATLPYTSLEQLLRTCSSLRNLKVTNLVMSNKVDMAFILRSFYNIKHLTLDSCKSQIIFTGEGEELLCNLELLSASNSNIDDKVLIKVAKWSPNLFHLDLEGCKRVTERGVREVAEHCSRLEHINLDGCVSVNKKVVSWMIAISPSVRYIVTPSNRDHTSVELDCFLEQGCEVIPGSKKLIFRRGNVICSWNDLFDCV